MTIATWSGFVQKFARPRFRVLVQKSASGGSGDVVADMFFSSPQGGSAPSTAVVPTRATTGSHPFHEMANATGGNSLYWVGCEALATIWNSSFNVISGSCALLIDRLSHQGGLVANVTTTQTTNLPTAALTRYTSGVGVMACVSSTLTGIGNTAATGTVSYTNQAGTAGRTGRFGTAGSLFTRTHFIGLQSGDTGIKSVESLTFTNSTGTAGNAGIILFKPLGIVYFPYAGQEDANPWTTGNMLSDPSLAIADDACLSFLDISSSTTSQHIGNFLFAEH